MLTREAWNALLKILEEPPPRVVFVFATTEPQRIQQSAAPVLSRVQRFDLKRIGPADVRERLVAVLAAEGIPAEPDALAMLARAADGSMRGALSLTDQVLSLGAGRVTAQGVRDALGLVHEDEHLALLDLVIEHRAGDVFTAVGRLADHGVDFGILLADFADLLRAQLAVVLGGRLPDVSEHLAAALQERARHFTPGDLLRMLNLVVEIEPHLKRSAQQQMLFETLLVRFALLDRTISLEEVLRGVAGGGGAPEPPARRAASTTRATPEPKREAAPVADLPAAPRDRKLLPLDINRLAEVWDEVVDLVASEGRAIASSTLGHATPTAVTAGGVVTLTVESEAHADIIVANEAAILDALRRRLDGVQRLAVRAVAPEGDRAPRRLNETAVKADRMALLRKQSRLLDAAVDALDLELLD